MGTWLDPLAWIGWAVAVVMAVLLAAEAFELVELAMPRPSEESHPRSDAWRPPAVSVYLPICSEPPDVVCRTLRALNALAFDDFEVLVVDNNTHDERLWRPVERLCHELGPRFRFFHLPCWPGYKAGALNFALAHTSRHTAIVAVIDADYEVAPRFLADLIGHFADERVGFVQAPQDYRDWEARYVARMCYWEYWQFFAVSMRLRRSRNAILLHGTMVLIRKEALARVGGWAEWCVTEDSELGLRLLASGYRGIYCGLTYGRGLVPFSFDAYLRQRRRWVTGGVQTLRRHWRLFLPWTRRLSTPQKLHYLQGWAPWMRDALVVASLPLAVVLSVGSLARGVSPEPIEPLTSAILLLVGYLALRQMLVYVAYLRRPWSDAVAAGHGILGMICTVGLAWIRGWQGFAFAFQRTPKEPQPPGGRLAALTWSLGTGAMLLLFAGAMIICFGRAGLGAAAGLTSYALIWLSWYSAELIDRTPAIRRERHADAPMGPRRSISNALAAKSTCRSPIARDGG
jgi:cellulose synthase/poly-beta-1,6-N-acetylglucosamine synthase-like glycosyltransferase